MTQTWALQLHCRAAWPTGCSWPVQPDQQGEQVLYAQKSLNKLCGFWILFRSVENSKIKGSSESIVLNNNPHPPDWLALCKDFTVVVLSLLTACECLPVTTAIMCNWHMTSWASMCIKALHSSVTGHSGQLQSCIATLPLCQCCI